MSASREKKSRQESLAGGYVDPRTKREKDEQAKDRRTNALYIAVAVIFVIVGIVVTVANSKVIERKADALTIGNETYTAADVSYFYNNIYSSFVSKNSYYLSAYGLDTTKSLKEQSCPINDGTWYDYFRDQAITSMTSYSLLAQKAEAEGFDGSEAVEQSVQDTFADLDTAAASAGHTRAQDAYDADPKSYQSADIEYILFTSAAGDDATDEEKAELLEQAKQKAETALSRYAQGETFDTIGEDMEGTYAHIGYAENGASDMLTWAFDDARQAGDTTVAANGEKGYYAVLFHSRSRDDYHTVSVRHILVDSEKKANELLQQYNDGEKTEDAFAALAVANSTDPGSASNGGLYSNIYKGEMVPSFEDWCFDPARQSGDTGIVESSNGYHVMYFVSTNENPYWYVQAETSLKSNAYDEWYSAITDGVEAEQLSGMKYVG